VKVRVVIRFWLREGILVVGVGGLSPGVEQHPGSRIELDLGDLRGRWALVILVVRAVVAERRHSLLLSFVVAVLGITVDGAEDLVDALALVLVFVLEEGSSFAGGVDVVHILVLMLAGSLEGEVLLHRHGIVREWRSVSGRRQYHISSVGSVVPEVDGLALRLAVLLEVLGLVYAVVPPTRVVVAVVPPARIVA
jgi:hypothetical protein